MYVQRNLFYRDLRKCRGKEIIFLFKARILPLFTVVDSDENWEYPSLGFIALNLGLCKKFLT